MYIINRKTIALIVSMILLMTTIAHAEIAANIGKDNFKEIAENRDGNTGDLTIENGAILWPKLSPEEQKHHLMKTNKTQKDAKNQNYLKALEESFKAEELVRTGKIAGKIVDFKSVPFDDTKPFSTRTIYQKYRNVPVRRQVKDYYCGPATVKQLDDYFNGDRYTQYQIANWLGTTTNGTDFSEVMQFLRDYVKSGYILVSIGAFSNWHRIVVNSINNDMPAVVDIKTTGISSFEYNTSGHILNVSGYRFGSVPNEVRVTDPHYKHSGTKMYPAHDLYKANNNHFRKQIIY